MLDKAEYSAFESTLNSPIVSYRIVTKEKCSSTERNPGCIESGTVAPRGAWRLSLEMTLKHGTTRAFDVFRTTHGRSAQTWFYDDKFYANICNVASLCCIWNGTA